MTAHPIIAAIVSVETYPYIAALWFASFGLRLALTAVIVQRKIVGLPKFFMAYTLLCDVKTALLLYCSALSMELAYSWIHWPGQYCLHLLVAAIAIDLLFRLFWPVKKLPKSLRDQWSLAATLLVLTVLLLRLAHRAAIQDWPTALTTSWDQTATVIVAGIFWLLSFGSDALGIPWKPLEYAVGRGFLIIYTIDLVTSSIRANLAGTELFWHQTLWTVELLAQVGVLLFWIRAFRKAAPAVRTVRLQDLATIRTALSLRDNSAPRLEP